MKPPLLTHRRSRSAFTLIEILLVVIILGVIATIVIASFANTSSSASATSLKDNLRTMRSAVQIYIAHHGSYPSVASFDAQMTQYSDQAGNTSATKDSTHVYGPYILELPRLPIGIEKGNTGVTGMSYTAGFGWQYDATTGIIHPNVQSSELDPEGVAYETY